MKRKPTILIILMVLPIIGAWPMATTVLAQTGGQYDLSWSTIDEGGPSSTGDSYWLGGTAGQIDASGPLTGGSFELTGGFWSIENGPPTAVTLASFTAIPQAGSILVAWETAMEIDTVGFNLYRAQSPSGDWVRLNAALIPSQSPGSVFGATYTWLDEDVASGITYYYRLEDVEVSGQRTFHGPITAQAGGPTSVILRALGSDSAHGGALLAVGLVVCLGGATLMWRARRRT
jgi:hypothetical protein